MKDSVFYDLCDKVENLSGEFTDGYFPTVQELKDHKVTENLVKYLPLLIYFASNPFKQAENPDVEEPEYLETVEYCKNIVASVELEES